MSVSIGDLFVRLLTDSSEFVAEMGKAGAKMGEFVQKTDVVKKGFDVMSKGIIAGASLAGAAMAVMTKEAMASEKSNLQLFASIKSVGMGSENAFKQLDDMAQALMKVSGVGDEEIKGTMQQLVQLTGDYNVALKYTKTAMDVSAATGRDLSSVTRALGMAYNGNTGMLTRLGVKIREGSKGMEALDQVTKKFKGSMEALSESTETKQKKVMTKVMEFAERIGTVLLPAYKMILDLVDKAVDWWDKLLSDEMTAKIIVWCINALGFITDVFIPGLIEGLVTGWKLLVQYGKTYKDLIAGIFTKGILSDEYKKMAVDNEIALRELYRDGGQMLQELFKNWEAGKVTLKEYMAEVNKVKDSYKALGVEAEHPLSQFEKDVESAIAKFQQLNDKAYEFENVVKAVSSTAAGAFTMLGEKLVETGGKMGEAWKDIFKTVLGTIIDGFIAQVTGQMAVYTAQLFNPAMTATAIGGLAVSAAELTGLGALKAGVAMMAEGGIVTSATPAIVGEAGPEAIIPLRKLEPMLATAVNNNVGPTTVNVLIRPQKIDNNTDFTPFGRKIKLAVQRNNLRTKGSI